MLILRQYTKGIQKGEAKNYRPIALASHVINILERIMAKNMAIYLEGNNIMNEEQHGFRMGHSCLSQLLSHHEKIVEGLENKNNIDVVYLDFAKAFDKVDHGILLHKIRVSGKLGEWLHCFLTGRVQTVTVGGAVSKPSVVVSGVPQGSVLGPILFLIHISNINEHVIHSSVASFADDTRVLREISSAADAHTLQADLNTIYSWAKTKKNMSFNENKFEHLSYSTDRNMDHYTYTAPDGSCIDTKDYVKDLGVTLSRDGTFGIHINNVAKRARNQAGWILRTFRTRDTVPMLSLYKSLVIPLLEYCCQL